MESNIQAGDLEKGPYAKGPPTVDEDRIIFRCHNLTLPTPSNPSISPNENTLPPGESPDNHLSQTCRVRSRPTAPRQRGPRTRWQAIATACDHPTRIWARAAKPRHTRIVQRRPVGRGP